MNSASQDFDAYHKWLGIAPKDQPPNHYRLLGIDLFESDPDVISGAAEQRMVYVRSLQLGPHSDLSQRILNEIAAAKVCLLHADERAVYDGSLRQQLEAAPSSDFIPPVSTTPPTQKTGQTWKLRPMVLIGAGVAIGSLVAGLILLPSNSKKPTAGELPKPEIVETKTVVPAQTSSASPVAAEAASETSQPPRFSDWVALVPLVQRDRDSYKASWRMVGDAVEFGAEMDAWVSFPLRIEGSYELQARVTILRAKGTTAFYLPVGGDKKIILAMSGDRGYGGSPTATIRLRGLKPEPKEGISMNVGTEYAFCCKVSVSKDNVDLEIRRDNRVLFQWSGDVSQVTGEYVLRPGTVELWTEYYSVSLYRDVRLRGERPPQGLPLAESRPSKRDSRISALLTSADEAGKTGDWSKAIADASEAVRLDPNDPEVYRLRARAFGKQGETDKAIADLDLAMWLHPTYADDYLERAVLYEKNGENDKALADLTRAARFDSRRVYATLQRGQLYQKVGRKIDAERDFFLVMKGKGETGPLQETEQRKSSQPATAALPDRDDTPSLAERARSRQEQWARLLGVPLEWVNSVGMKFLLIPPCEFEMGLTPEEKHGIQIGRAFCLGVYEVTQEEYEKVMGVNPSHFSRNGQGKDRIPQDTSRYPVENVSWEDAVEFCRRLSAMPDEQTAHRTYRLPTEAEWEYACRGGTVGKWCCGDDEGVLKDYAWYNESSTHPVGQKKPNAWGLYDMHGNVSEWCINWFGPYPKSTANTPGPATGSERVWRGGSFNWGADYALSGMRNHATPDRRTPGYGFRVACCRSDEEKSYVLAMAKPNRPAPTKEQEAVKAKPESLPNAASKPIDPNRAAAEVVFRHDGEIMIRGDKRIYRHIEELPVGEFSFSLLKTGGEPLSDDEVRTIGNIPKPEQLDQLLIDHARRVTDGGAKFIATRFPHLTCLSINISQVTDAGLAELSRLRNLKGFAIQSCPVTDAGIGHIRKLVDLDWLGLWNTSVTDDGLKELSDLQKLRTLTINGCEITDAGLEHLKGLKSLREVQATGTKITKAGVRRFNEARPDVKVILSKGQNKRDSIAPSPKPQATEVSPPQHKPALTGAGSPQQDSQIQTLLTSVDGAGKRGDWSKAIADASEVIRLDPNNPEGYRLRARAFGKQGENDKAIADLDFAIKLDPAHPCTYMARAWQWDAKGDLSRAIADFNEGMRLNPEYADGYVARASLYRKKGENDKALADLTQAIRIDPRHINAYSQRGQLYQKLGRKQEAEADIATASRLKEENAVTQQAEQPKPAQPATATPPDRADTPPLAVAPFGPEKARSYQEQWAKLGVPLEQSNSIGMKLKFIPPGEFLMGSPTTEQDRRKDEYQHRVRVTKPFYLGVCEVTQAEYERIMGKTPSYFSKNGKQAEKVQGMDTSRFPVEQVSWEDAVEFCRRLSALPEEKAAGRVYRLPTEAEWEYACRAGMAGRFCFGDDVTAFGEYAWYEDNSDKMPHPVGEKKPNAWGLHDMHGNVFEWCQDWYDEGYYEKSPLDDPTGPASGEQRVLRGTCWHCYPQRCSHRQARPAPMYNALWGFRVVCVQ